MGRLHIGKNPLDKNHCRSGEEPADGQVDEGMAWQRFRFQKGGCHTFLMSDSQPNSEFWNTLRMTNGPDGSLTELSDLRLILMPGFSQR